MITVILCTPCWRYGGGSFTQKDRKSKNRVMCFFVLQYFEPFGSHTTSNFSIHRYIYITVILWLPCWRYGGGSFTQIDRKSKNRVYVFLCFAIYWAVQYSCNLELLYIYVYIYNTSEQTQLGCTLELAVHPTNQGWLGYRKVTWLITQQTRVSWGIQ